MANDGTQNDPPGKTPWTRLAKWSIGLLVPAAVAIGIAVYNKTATTEAPSSTAIKLADSMINDVSRVLVAAKRLDEYLTEWTAAELTGETRLEMLILQVDVRYMVLDLTNVVVGFSSYSIDEAKRDVAANLGDRIILEEMDKWPGELESLLLPIAQAYQVVEPWDQPGLPTATEYSGDVSDLRTILSPEVLDLQPLEEIRNDLADWRRRLSQ